MTDESPGMRNNARIALAAIRLFNGIIALLVPAAIVRRMGPGPEANPAAPYLLRMFGIRTVLIGAELLMPAGEARTRALRTAPLIHAVDLAAAITSGIRGQLPRRAATTVALISLMNFTLSMIAQPGKD